jgi:hypothetical protein
LTPLQQRRSYVSREEQPTGRAKKIEQLLGRDAAPEDYLKRLNAKGQPWYLRSDYKSSDIQITPDGAVRGGTLLALIEHLTAHELSTSQFSGHVSLYEAILSHICSLQTTATS